MNGLWTKYAGWFGALAQRERLVLGAATLFAIVFIGYVYFIDPALKRETRATRLAGDARITLVALDNAAKELAARTRDPDADLRAEQGRLQEALTKQAERFRVVESSTIPAQEIPRLLESIVGKAPGLTLLSLRTEPAQPLLTPSTGGEAGDDAAKPAGPGANLYRHRVQIRLEGGYRNLLEYLARLEAEAPTLGWADLSLDAQDYPKSVLTLTVQTLSLDSAWLEL